jgi:hypothetical protein
MEFDKGENVVRQQRTDPNDFRILLEALAARRIVGDLSFDAARRDSFDDNFSFPTLGERDSQVVFKNVHPPSLSRNSWKKDKPER